MKFIKVFIFSLFILSLYNCKEEPLAISETDPITSTFYFIRHAEKDRSDLENDDPELNQDGLGRAVKWAEVMNDVEINAIYTTDFARTSMTAAPTAVKKNITLQYYNPIDMDIEQFKVDNLGNNVLVIGHSDSTPDFVNKIIGEEKYDALDDYDNGSLFIVRVIDSLSSDIRLHIN